MRRDPGAMRPCKYHRYEHLYTRHACGHDYCAIYWPACPRCHAVTPRPDQRKERDVKPIHPIVRQIIDRDCHVGWSNREVIRHVISRLKKKYQTFRAMPKADRRWFMRQCLQVHADNRALYRQVMR